MRDTRYDNPQGGNKPLPIQAGEVAELRVIRRRKRLGTLMIWGWSALLTAIFVAALLPR